MLTDAPHVATQREVNELHARLPGAIGTDAVRALVAQTDAELATALDESTIAITRAYANDYPVLDRWSRAVSSDRAQRTLRAYVAILEEASRRGGLAHRPAELLEEYEVLPLVTLAVSDAALQDLQRRVQLYGDTVSTIRPADLEWNRIRDTARWASARLDALAARLGARPGPAGMRVRDAYAPWLLESGRTDEAARMFAGLETLPGHATPAWRYLIARAFEANGQHAEGERVMRSADAPGRYEPYSERMARLRVRGAMLERETRGATEPERIRARVWALLILGRNGEALTLVRNAPSAALVDPAVIEARAVALAVDGANGMDLWTATDARLPGAHEGYDAVRLHAGFLRLRTWQFPRRLDGAPWSPPDAAVIAELRTRLATAHLASDQVREPLAWHLDLATLPASPTGLANTPRARALLTQLATARAGSDKTLQLYAAAMELVLRACTGDAASASTTVASIHPDPSHADDAASVRGMALAMRALFEPSETTRAALYAEVEQRAGGERGYSARLVSTAILYDAIALARYEAATTGDREAMRPTLLRAVAVTAQELDQRSDNALVTQGLYGPVYLQGALLSTSEQAGLAYLARTPSIWSERFGTYVTGVRRAWSLDLRGAMTAFEACASDASAPMVAARCAHWRSVIGRRLGDTTATRSRWDSLATRYAAAAIAVDGSSATGTARDGDLVPLAIAAPRTEIDLETWRLTHHWVGSVGWLLAPRE